jgi:hypothetical protein
MAGHVFDVPDWVSGLGGGTVGGLAAANNLSDLTSAAAARTNLGLGSAATKNIADFDLAGAASAAAASAIASIPIADTSHNGLLSAADWQLFRTAATGSVPTGNLTEATSGILTITGGIGAVVGSGTSLTVKKATATVDGYLAATDFATFNAKQAALGFTPLNPANNLSDLASGATARTNLGLSAAAVQSIANLTEATSAVLTITGGTGAVLGSGATIQVKKATSTADGYLSAGDWVTFSGKQAALGYTPLNPANNLSELTASAANVRTNLGLGSAATQATSAFDAAGAATSAVAAIPSASGSTRGLLTAGDWTTFNNKQAALTTGNLTEFGSNVFTITGGTGAVIGSGVTLQMTRANAANSGYLLNTDWQTFNNKQNPLTFSSVTESGSSVLTIVGGTNAVIGSSGVTIAVKVANTSQSGYLTSTDWNTFNAKQVALGFTPASLTANTFTGNQILSSANGVYYSTANAATWTLFREFASQGAAVANDAFALQYNTRSTAGGTDAWSDVFRVTALTGALALSSALTTAAVTLGGTLNLNGQVVSGSTTGNLTVGRAATYASAAVAWSLNVLNSGGGDNVSLGQSSATYATGGTLGWVGNSNAFLYWNSTQDFRIGTGTGSTPVLTFKGNGNLLINTATDNAITNDRLQISGNLISTAGSFGSTPNYRIQTVGAGNPVSARLGFGTDNTGWQLRIAKNVAGAYTDLITVSDANPSVAAARAGYVGIGTVTPTTGLHVNTAATFAALFSPGAPTVSASSGSSTYVYAIAALQQDGAMTLIGPTGQTTTSLNPPTSGSPNNLTWTAVSGAYSYAVYRTAGGATQGLLGYTTTTTFSDTGLTASGSVPAANTTGAVTMNGSLNVLGAATLGVVTIGNTLTLNAGATFNALSTFNVGATFNAIATFNAVLTGTSASGGNGALNAKVAGQAAIDLWDTVTGGTPSTGSRWRIFADNVGGGGGSLTFCFYDLANSRSVGGFDNNGWFAASVGLNIGNAANVNIGSNWQNWSPSVTSFMSLSGISIADAQYLRIGPIVYVKFDISFTCGGSAADRVFVSLPVAPVGNPQIQYAAISFGSANALQATWAYAEASSTTIQVLTNLQSNYPLGFVRFLVNGQYRCL